MEVLGPGGIAARGGKSYSSETGLQNGFKTFLQCADLQHYSTELYDNLLIQLIFELKTIVYFSYFSIPDYKRRQILHSTLVQIQNNQTIPVKSKKQESLLASIACWQPVILQPSSSSGSLLKASAASDPLTPMQTPVLLPRIAAGFSPKSQHIVSFK